MMPVLLQECRTAGDTTYCTIDNPDPQAGNAIALGVILLVFALAVVALIVWVALRQHENASYYARTELRYQRERERQRREAEYRAFLAQRREEP